MSEFWKLYKNLAKKHDTIISLAEGEFSIGDISHLQQKHLSLWQTIRGLPLLCCGELALELVICCSLVQLELFLYLNQRSLSSAETIVEYFRLLKQRLSVHFSVSDDEEQVYSAISTRHAKDFIGVTFSRVYTIVAVMELMSSSTHEQASRRLALAHQLLSCEDHETCKDWFHCLLKIKAMLADDDRADLDYFEGWWYGGTISSSSDLACLWDGTYFAQKGSYHLALCKYRQCLLEQGSECTIPVLLNCALVFHKLHNSYAEMDARILLLKALQSAPPTFSCAMIWRKEKYISSDSGVYNQTQLRRSAHTCAQRALFCGRPKLAVSVLEGVSDILSLPGVASGIAPALMMLRSLLELERMREALDVCLKIVTSLRSTSHLVHAQTGVQLAEALLLGSMAATKLNQFDLAYLLAERCYSLSTSFYSEARPALTQHCSKLMQLSLVVRAVLLVGAGRLTSALSLLTFAAVEAPLTIVEYTLSLVNVKLAQCSHSECSRQSLTPLLGSFESIEHEHVQ